MKTEYPDILLMISTKSDDLHTIKQFVTIFWLRNVYDHILN